MVFDGVPDFQIGFLYRTEEFVQKVVSTQVTSQSKKKQKVCNVRLRFGFYHYRFTTDSSAMSSRFGLFTQNRGQFNEF
jgi:hypothetical protein